MKLVRYSTRGSSPRLGALVGDRIRCLGETYHRLLAGRGVVRAGELAHALFPPSARDFLRAGAAAEDALHAMESAVKAGKLEWMTHPASEAHLHAPIHDPEKFLCIGLNYIDHAEETKSPIPKEPPLFAKFPNSIVDAKGCEKLDYEVELGFVIGREAKDVPAERALDYIWGYLVVNDVSARDFQLVTSQWMAGKACDAFAPMGPWIADRAEVPDPHVLELRTWVNGEKLQDGNSKNLIYNINYLVAFLTAKMTLLPGDVVITGTPAGVGFTRKPPVLLKGGDRVRMEITGLGTLDNPVVDA
jgi:acylpyruvate hydrolase